MDKHVFWLWILGAIPLVQGAVSVFASYMPTPGSPGESRWYPAIFHTMQYIALNIGRSQAVKSKAVPESEIPPSTVSK